MRRWFFAVVVFAGLGLEGRALAATADASTAAPAADAIASLAVNPFAAGVLLAVGLLGLLIEMQTLSGIAGTIGALALASFFALHLYAGFADWLAIVIAIGGVIAILIELHVLPGQGIAGGLGIAALVTAIMVSFGGDYVGVALQALAIAILLSILGFWVATRFFPKNAFFEKLAFTGVQGPHYVTSADFTHLLGASGVTASYLRPAGVATIDGERVDVLTEGGFVPAGTRVRVTRVEGARVFVVPEERASS